METNIEVEKLNKKVQQLLDSDHFKELSVVYLAIELEKIIKKVIVYNYRKAGFSALFIRKRLLDKMSYSQLISEFEWSSSDKISLTYIWRSRKMEVTNLSGIMKVRNIVMHSNDKVSLKEIQKSVKELIYVIENLSLIFSTSVGHNGFDTLPKTFPKNKLNLSSKMLNKSIVAVFNR